MPAQKVDVVVHGGTVVTATTSFEGSVAIQGEQIAAVGPQDLMPDAELTIDATGKYVLPGAIDCHAHFGNADDHDLGPKAAALAGLTTVIPFMHYNRGEGETLPDAINRDEAGAQHTDGSGLHATLRPGPPGLHRERHRRGHPHGGDLFQDVH